MSNNPNYKSIVESFNDAVMRFDREHRYTYANKAIEKFWHISKEGYIGKTNEELSFPKELCDLWEKSIEQVFTTSESRRIEFVFDNERAVDWLLTPEFDDSNEVEFVLATAREITHLHNSRNKLKDSQNRFTDAFRLARLSTWEIDVSEKKTFLNAEFCNIIGVPFNPDTPYMDSDYYFNHFVYDEDKEVFQNTFRLAVKQAEDDSYQGILSYRITRPDGKLIWVLATIRTRVNDENQVIGAYGTFQDITNIKQTEQELEKHKLHLEELVEKRTCELQESESKLKDAVDLAKLSTWEYTVSTEKLSISGLLERRLDKSRFESNNTLKIDVFIDAIHPDDFKVFYDAIQEAILTEDQDLYNILSFRMYDMDNELHHMNITVKVRLDQSTNRTTAIYGTIQDVTYLVENKVEKERLTSIIEATSDIVLMANTNNEIIYINKAGRYFFGYSEDYRIDTIKLESIYIDSDSDKLKNSLSEVNSKNHWVGENVLKKYDGTEVPVSEVMLAHRNQLGAIDCYSITLRDLSKQKEIEHDLIYKNTELDTFVYRVSHDLRGPIASMLGLYNVVKHEVNDPTSLDFFEMYNKQIIRLNETIIALIDLTRIKEQETRKEVIDFEQIIDGSITSFRHLPHFDSISFNTNILINKELLSDKSLLNTIIQNLIENSIKYCNIENDPFVNIDIEQILDKGNTILSIKVEDNGMGIRRDAQKKVFDMFFRGSTMAIGSGLGLYILKNAVEKLNGKVLLKSVEGKGTTFQIKIPI